MTSRLLLTLIALLTGLAAEATPAQARQYATRAVEIGIVVGVAEVRQERLRASLAGHVTALAEPGRAERRFAFPVGAAPASATVLTGIDRARE